MDEIWTWLFRTEIEINESLLRELLVQKDKVRVVKDLPIEYWIAKVESRIDEIRTAVRENRLC